MFSDFPRWLSQYGIGILLLLANVTAISPGYSAPLSIKVNQSTANYAYAPSIKHLWHWKQFPIRVFVATHNPDEEREAQSTLAGFDEWVQATNGVVKYCIVNSPSQADLTVRFITDESLPGQPNVAGETSLSARRGTIQAAAMTLATGNATPEDLQSTAAHEFGHVLGIGGHSDVQDDLMYPVAIRYLAFDGTRINRPARRVTLRDLNTLRICYPSLLE